MGIKDLVYIAIIIIIGIRTFSYYITCRGLIYFAITEHNWDLSDDKEIKRITKYAIKRFFKQG